MQYAGAHKANQLCFSASLFNENSKSGWLSTWPPKVLVSYFCMFSIWLNSKVSFEEMSGALKPIALLPHHLARHQSHKLLSKKFHFVLVKLINSLVHPQPRKQLIHCL